MSHEDARSEGGYDMAEFAASIGTSIKRSRAQSLTASWLSQSSDTSWRITSESAASNLSVGSAPPAFGFRHSLGPYLFERKYGQI